MGNIALDTDAAEAMTYEPLPAGWYKAAIINSEVKPTAAGTGTYLKAEWLITEPGDHEGRKVWEMYTLTNPNDMAVKIGRGQLSAAAKAMGKKGIVDDSQDLHDKEILIKLKIEPAAGQYGPKNRIVGYDPLPKPVVTSDELPWQG